MITSATVRLLSAVFAILTTPAVLSAGVVDAFPTAQNTPAPLSEGSVGRPSVPDSCDTLTPKTQAARPFVPSVSGVVVGRYEDGTEDGYGRFAVRNARVALRARLYDIFELLVNTDFCDQGSVKILDAWGAVDLTGRLNFRLGQFRMPFGQEMFLGPATYIFANRSLLVKNMCNYRAVGAQLSWKPFGKTLELAGGIFNPYTITDHKKWTRTYSASGTARLTLGDWKLNTGFMSVEPDSVRINLVNFGLQWRRGGLLLDAEYLYRHYTNKAHAATHGYVVYGDYAHPMRGRLFNRWSAQLRADGITDNSSGIRDAAGRLVTDNPLQNRITVGGTLAHDGAKGLSCRFRLNYEKYFFGHIRPDKPGSGDKIVAELVLVF